MMLSLYWDDENYSVSACDDAQGVFVEYGLSRIRTNMLRDESEVHKATRNYDILIGQLGLRRQKVVQSCCNRYYYVMTYITIVMSAAG